MWAVGVILYTLLCGFPPFRSPERDQEELFHMIQLGRFEFLAPYWDNISDGETRGFPSRRGGAAQREPLLGSDRKAGVGSDGPVTELGCRPVLISSPCVHVALGDRDSL